MFRTFLQFLGIFLTLGSSVFLLKGNLGLGVETIAEISRTKARVNPHAVRSLAAQQADTRVGLALLLLGVRAQLWNAGWQMRWTDFAVSPLGIFLALGAAALLTAAGWMVSERRTEATVAKVRADIEAEQGPTPDKIWERR